MLKNIFLGQNGPAFWSIFRKIVCFESFSNPKFAATVFKQKISLENKTYLWNSLAFWSSCQKDSPWKLYLMSVSLTFGFHLRLLVVGHNKLNLRLVQLCHEVFERGFLRRSIFFTYQRNHRFIKKRHIHVIIYELSSTGERLESFHKPVDLVCIFNFETKFAQI